MGMHFSRPKSAIGGYIAVNQDKSPVQAENPHR